MVNDVSNKFLSKNEVNFFIHTIHGVDGFKRRPMGLFKGGNLGNFAALREKWF